MFQNYIKISIYQESWRWVVASWLISNIIFMFMFFFGALACKLRLCDILIRLYF